MILESMYTLIFNEVSIGHRPAGKDLKILSAKEATNIFMMHILNKGLKAIHSQLPSAPFSNYFHEIKFVELESMG